MNLALWIGFGGVLAILLQLLPVLNVIGNGSIRTHFLWSGEDILLHLPKKGLKIGWNGFTSCIVMIAFSVITRKGDEPGKVHQAELIFPNVRSAKRKFGDVKTVVDKYFKSHPVLELDHKAILEKEKIIIQLWRLNDVTSEDTKRTPREVLRLVKGKP